MICTKNDDIIKGRMDGGQVKQVRGIHPCVSGDLPLSDLIQSFCGIEFGFGFLGNYLLLGGTCSALLLGIALGNAAFIHQHQLLLRHF